MYIYIIFKKVFFNSYIFTLIPLFIFKYDFSSPLHDFLLLYFCTLPHCGIHSGVLFCSAPRTAGCIFKVPHHVDEK